MSFGLFDNNQQLPLANLYHQTHSQIANTAVDTLQPKNWRFQEKTAHKSAAAAAPAKQTLAAQLAII